MSRFGLPTGPAASGYRNGRFSKTQKPNPNVPDPVQEQGVAVNTSRWLKHFYTQHDQNLVVVLPGDILFNFMSGPHENISNGTLIVRSLPALNALMRTVGPNLSPMEIWENFKFIGVCDTDAAFGDNPLLRLISIVHSGVMRIPNLFDDVSLAKPGTPKHLPRYAYLWLRPYCDDPVTGQPVPFIKRVVPLKYPTDTSPAGLPAEAAVANADAEGDADGDAVFDGDHDLHGDSALQHLMSGDLGASLFDVPDEKHEVKSNAGSDDSAHRLLRRREEHVLEVASQAGEAYPVMKHEFYWQYIPVCSTHPDLLAGGDGVRSAARREADGGYPFRVYDYGIFLGLMFTEPTRGKPNDLSGLAVKYAIHGPFGLHRHYDETMLEERWKLRSVDVHSQTV